jgi:glycerol-3-phosphate acyltransferase PlsY
VTSFIVAAATAYLLGSIPFAFLLARRRGIDLRRAGSGNVGASNVLRTSGVSLAVLAMA